MCRVLIYKGEAVRLDDLLYQPNNSLLRQAYDPQMVEAMSLGGFGLLAWDTASRDPDTHFSYRSTDLPIFDRNLQELAEKLWVTTLIAHVRGVPYSAHVTVGEQNLHPFHYKGYRLAMAHNGDLADFDIMRFSLVAHVKPEIARLIRGNTDSEWIYAILLSQLTDPHANQTADEVVEAVEKTFAIIREVRHRHGIATSSSTNLFLSDGRFVVAVRYAFDYGCYDMTGDRPRPNFDHGFLGMWYTTGASYRLQDGEWKMVRGGGEPGRSLLISSEPLTRDTSTWLEVPEYSALISTPDRDAPAVRIRSLDETGVQTTPGAASDQRRLGRASSTEAHAARAVAAENAEDDDMIRRFENKIAIVTGGGTGIGLAAAQRFVAEGGKVLIVGRREDVLTTAAQSIDQSGEKVATLAADVGQVTTATRAVDLATQRFGGVDVLFNNAGIFKPTPFLEHSEADFDRYLTTILKGKFFMAQAAARAMQARGGGAIVHTGSMWAERAVVATPSSAYSAANAGVHAMVRNLAVELAVMNIRINAVAPAVVETPVYGTFLSPEQVKEVLPGFNSFHPLGRIGQPADVVGAMLFLASNEASWITGVILPVDGGVMASR